MNLQDYNEDENRLTAQRGGAGWSGLGRTATENNVPILIAQNDAVSGEGGGGEYTTYVDVTGAADTSAPVIPRTMATGVQPLQLPQFDFATNVSSCTSCATDTSATADKVAAANAAAVVTPLPDAPKTINWLLILGGVGLGFYLLKGGPTPGMGNPEPELAPVEEGMGRPPRKPKAKLRHVESLKI